MANTPDAQTVSDLQACNALFETFMDELVKDFAELIENAYPEGDGPQSQDMINVAFVGFCLGALAATSEDSHFLESLTQNASHGDSENMVQ